MAQFWAGALSEQPASEPLKVWRYYLPREKGEGWAVAILDESGFFACVSDWGNYAYRGWSFAPQGFREFFVGLGGDYLAGKIAQGRKEYDAEATLISVKRQILDLRRRRVLTKNRAGEEWNVLERCDWLATEAGFALWNDQNLLITDASEHYKSRRPSDVLSFCERVLPRLQAAIREQLATEQTLRIAPDAQRG